MNTFEAAMVEQIKQQRNVAHDLLANANGRIAELTEQLADKEKELQALREKQTP